MIEGDIMKKILPLALIFISFLMVSCSKSTITLKGDIENNIISANSTVAGKIIELNKNQGEHVKKGDIIAVVENTNDKYAVEQLKSMVEVKKAKLLELKAGSRPEQIEQARNNVSISQEALNSAKSSFDYINSQYNNALTLYNNGYASKTDLDAIKYKLDTADSQLASAKYQLSNANQQLNLISSGSRIETINAANADYEATKVQLSQAENRLKDYNIIALADGIIISKNFELGDIINIGSNLADIAIENDIYLLCWLPEKYLDKVYYDQELTVTLPNGTQTGKVSYIALKSEYTPKDKQSSTSDTSSVKIKVKLDDNNGKLKSGISGKVTIPLK